MDKCSLDKRCVSMPMGPDDLVNKQRDEWRQRRKWDCFLEWQDHDYSHSDFWYHLGKEWEHRCQFFRVMDTITLKSKVCEGGSQRDVNRNVIGVVYWYCAICKNLCLQGFASLFSSYPSLKIVFSSSPKFDSAGSLLTWNMVFVATELSKVVDSYDVYRRFLRTTFTPARDVLLN